MASILDSLLASSSFLRLSGPKTDDASAAPPVVIVVVVDDAAAAAETDVAGCASFDLSIEPVSLKPDPLLGFLSRDGVMRKERGKKNKKEKRFSRLKKIS